MIKAKICGITNLADARVSVGAGCDALGFIFYRKSKRYISPERARRIIEALSPRVIKIGVFVNAREKTVRRISKMCRLDMLQFHGNESPEYCARFKQQKVIKAFRVDGSIDLDNLLRYQPFAYLFDTFVPAKMGGTGKKFDWRLIRHIDGIKRPVFLSGGLTAQNVKQAIKVARPHWVDVSSSVEVSPGKKDHKKVAAFIKAAKAS